MEATLRALGEILLKAVPTLVLVLLLHFYLKRVFFAPLERVLKSRYEVTEGARHAADLSLRHAEQKAAAYGSALQVARLELYREQEEHRNRRRLEQAAVIEDARARTREQVQEAHRQMDHEADEARRSMMADTERLAEEIAHRVLVGRAA